MSLIMRDSIDPSLIPVDTPVVAGYGDGRYQWSSAGWARFPNSIGLSIVCFPGSAGDILDIETGCASPVDAPGWCDRFNRPGRRAPTLYVNRQNWSAVRAAVGSRQVDYWVATLDGTQDVPGAVAVQYTDTGAYDESVINDPTWVGEAMIDPTQIQAIYNYAKGTYDGVAADSSTAQLKQSVAAILAAVQAPPIDVNALAAALATHPLTATLTDDQLNAIASHVLQHLSKDTAAG